MVSETRMGWGEASSMLAQSDANNYVTSVDWPDRFFAASVTGFLETDPSVSQQFGRAVALAVGIAVFFSYPLQLYPALQVHPCQVVTL